MVDAEFLGWFSSHYTTISPPSYVPPGSHSALHRLALLEMLMLKWICPLADACAHIVIGRDKSPPPQDTPRYSADIVHFPTRHRGEVVRRVSGLKRWRIFTPLRRCHWLFASSHHLLCAGILPVGGGFLPSVSKTNSHTHTHTRTCIHTHTKGWTHTHKIGPRKLTHQWGGGTRVHAVAFKLSLSLEGML